MHRYLLPMLLMTLLSSAHAGTWVLVGQGDCPGPHLGGNSGKEPEFERCNPEFAGKTALCYTKVCNPGCDFIDLATKDCRGGTELADVYTCVVEPPSLNP
jgi:hypothetical protein